MLAIPVGSLQLKEHIFVDILIDSLTKKREAEKQCDKEEFQAFMNLELDPEERQRIDTMHY